MGASVSSLSDKRIAPLPLAYAKLQPGDHFELQDITNTLHMSSRGDVDSYHHGMSTSASLDQLPSETYYEDDDNNASSSSSGSGGRSRSRSRRPGTDSTSRRSTRQHIHQLQQESLEFNASDPVTDIEQYRSSSSMSNSSFHHRHRIIQNITAAFLSRSRSRSGSRSRSRHVSASNSNNSADSSYDNSINADTMANTLLNNHDDNNLKDILNDHDTCQTNLSQPLTSNHPQLSITEENLTHFETQNNESLNAYLFTLSLDKGNQDPTTSSTRRQLKPLTLGQLASRTTIGLCSQNIVLISPHIGLLSMTTTLQLCCNELTSIPPEIGYMASLSVLSLAKNRLTCLPESMAHLTQLTELRLSENCLTNISSMCFRGWSKLKLLALDSNMIEKLPVEIGDLKDLVSLNVASNPIQSFPAEISRLKVWGHILFLYFN